jgi:hypothetical protein
MSSIHLSTFSGPAFIQRSARLVNKMNNLWLTALVLHYPNSKNSNSCAISRWHSLWHTKLLEMLFLLSWDTQGVCSGYVTRTHLFALHWIKFKENSGLWRKRAKHCQVYSNQKLEVYYFCCFNFCFLHNFVPVLTASSSPQKRWRLLKRKHAPAQHHTRVVCYGTWARAVRWRRRWHFCWIRQVTYFCSVTTFILGLHIVFLSNGWFRDDNENISHSNSPASPNSKL